MRQENDRTTEPGATGASTRLARRSLLAAAATLVPGIALARDYAGSAPPIRYPDPDIIVLDKRFAPYKLGNAAIERLWTGARWMEGPAWCGTGNYLVWSDIPNSRQMRWLNEDGHVSKLRDSNFSNGNTFDWEGRQLSCEHRTRRVVRYEHDDTVTVLADHYNGKRFNAPNDLVVHPDGGVWFSDPGYGTLGNYEGEKGPQELKEAVYRIDPKNHRVEKVIDEMYRPNGLCFSPDYKKLYVADTGADHYPEAPRNVRVYDVVDEKKVARGREFFNTELNGKHGFADGIRADRDGNIWAAAGWVGEGYDGVHIHAPDGTRIGQILLPEICGNLTFGGPRRNRLFMAAGQSLYSLYVEAQGAHIC